MIRSLRVAAIALGLAAVSATGAFPLDGDVTGDGVFDLRDPLALCRFLSGKNQSLPAAQNGDVNFDGVLSRADLDLMMQAMIGVPLPAPPLSASPASLDFGDVEVGDELTRGFDIRNNGAVPTTVNSIALSVSLSPAFSIVSRPPLPVTIPAGGSVSVTVRYAPTMVGDDLSSVGILGAGPPLFVALKGHAVAPPFSVSPTAMPFGDILVGNESLLDFEIRNDGNVPLAVQSVAPAPGTSAAFTVHAAPPTPFSIAPGDHALVTIRYAPAQTGPDAGSIDVVTGAGSANVALTGRGVAPALDVAPGAIDFASVLAGDAQSRNFTITNSGSAPLEVTGVGLQIGSSPDFHLAPLPPTPFTIDPGDSRMVEVDYLPSGVGTDTGKVEIHTNAGDAFVDLVGAGVAPVIDVVPLSLDFMNVLVGQTKSLPVEIVNSGSADLTLSVVGLLVGGVLPPVPPPMDFALQNVPALPVTVAPGTSRVVDVVYAPLQVGGDTTAVHIESNDPATPMVDVPVTGNGVQPGVMVHPNLLLFSNVRAGQVADRDFDITNSGGLDLFVTALAVDPNSSA
ncbi:MAG TPA: choice-of-anchor D domain-containing protein, partial [Verrucomicrobiae bacterium]|nr:choice-of-anchor D domain-containing protein [Verrucomicrobiae bacterium]